MKTQKTTHSKNRNFVCILTSLIFIGLLGLAEMSLAAETWVRKADMPTTRSRLSTSVVNGIIYAIGGKGSDNSLLSTVEAYDPETDTWTKKADMPTPRQDLSTSVVNGKIYAIGGGALGRRLLSTVEAYDPATDTWTKKADMPTARAGHLDRWLVGVFDEVVIFRRALADAEVAKLAKNGIGEMLSVSSKGKLATTWAI